MPGRSGMEIARELRRRNRKMLLIFVTALEEHVFQAFDVGASHYLVKPFSDEIFAEVMANAVRQYQEQTQSLGEPYFLIKMGGVHTRVRWRDVLYAEVFNRKVLIHTVHGDAESTSQIECRTGAGGTLTYGLFAVNMIVNLFPAGLLLP